MNTHVCCGYANVTLHRANNTQTHTLTLLYDAMLLLQERANLRCCRDAEVGPCWRAIINANGTHFHAVWAERRGNHTFCFLSPVCDMWDLWDSPCRCVPFLFLDAATQLQWSHSRPNHTHILWSKHNFSFLRSAKCFHVFKQKNYPLFDPEGAQNVNDKVTNLLHLNDLLWTFD